MIKVAVFGAKGRMGREICKAVDEAADLQLVAGVDAGDDRTEVEKAQVVIDFTHPDAVMDNIKWCIDHGINAVVGTTGFSPAKYDEVRGWLAAKPGVNVLIASNFSIAAVLLMHFAAKAAPFFESVEVIELHHPRKVDAPSGTALKMGEVIAAAQNTALADRAVYERYGHTGARKAGSIGFATIRGGDIVGDHTVLFAGTGERIEISHKSSNRQGYAQGALRAARFLADKRNGLYDMYDVLNLR